MPCEEFNHLNMSCTQNAATTQLGRTMIVRHARIMRETVGVREDLHYIKELEKNIITLKNIVVLVGNTEEVSME